ncbi:MAG: DUF1156 domain-containing protein [Armatimonadetes bacterium]|nr:DUF1156 domain-containing protein [Armatimonadota bacterium]
MIYTLFTDYLKPNPNLVPIPQNETTRLVDEGMLQYEASLGGFAERYRRGETPHTIHVWWARRPHSAMRALIYACLSKGRSREHLAIMRELSTSSKPSLYSLEKARNTLIQDYISPPRVLDMFGGSGTIPFEAAILGAEAYSIDSNELSIFIQKNLMEASQVCDHMQLQALIYQAGKRVLDKLTHKTASLFPLRPYANTYLWTYSQKCPSCNYKFLLSKRLWLAKKPNKYIALKVNYDEHKYTINIDRTCKDIERQNVWNGRNGSVTCPKCSKVISGISIKNCQDEIIAYIGANGKCGKQYHITTPENIPDMNSLESIESNLLESLNTSLPNTKLPCWSGIVNPAIYGIETHADFMNKRQKLVILHLIECLTYEYIYLKELKGENIAIAVIGMLSGLIDQLVDWNCRLSMWIPQNEQVGRAFCGPGVPMLWDYAETDPIQNGPSNLWDKLNRIADGTAITGLLNGNVNIQKGYAQRLPYRDEYFDAIVTDPPYYDNIYYNVLADFFFAWKRILLKKIVPDLFDSVSTDSSHELVASTFRSGAANKAHEDYCKQLALAIAEADRVLKVDGVFALLFSHSSLQGWESLVRAYRPSGLVITSVQPLSIERKARPRAIGSNAVNTCVVFVAHKSDKPKEEKSIYSLTDELRNISSAIRQSLEDAGWQHEDIAVACFAQSVGMLLNVKRVIGCMSDIDALKCFESVIKEIFPSFHITNRRSL